jgi:hypothetical protein
VSTDARKWRFDAAWLTLLESFGERERLTSLAFVAGQEVTFDEEGRNEALRRAVVVRAVGGDPHRELTLDEDAVTRLAEELDDPQRRAQLETGLAALALPPAAPSSVTAALDALVASPDLAWRAFCAALLAAELAGE